ncbi:MAG: hypothetical protein M1604_02190 [Patescibacteria group bacterium]|nr:hypothetical protein [Patescibacteria group bacterium]
MPSFSFGYNRWKKSVLTFPLERDYDAFILSMFRNIEYVRKGRENKGDIQIKKEIKLHA